MDAPKCQVPTTKDHPHALPSDTECLNASRYRNSMSFHIPALSLICSLRSDARIQMFPSGQFRRLAAQTKAPFRGDICDF